MAKRILVVDDDPDICSLIKTALIFKEYEVAVANDGFSAATMAAQYLPDLIILDVMMPKMDGFRVCRNLRQMDEFRETPIVFLTAKDSESDEEWGKRMGGTRYLTKPLDMKLLMSTVQECLEQVEGPKDRPDLEQMKRDAKFEG